VTAIGSNTVPHFSEESMRVVVTFELQGTPEEIGPLLSHLSETITGAESEEGQDSSWWTPERAASFVSGLTEPALGALRIIAEGAPRVPFAEVQRRMGIPGLKLAGRLSSIGFAVSRMGGPVPFVRDYYQRVYHIDPEVAKILREAVVAEEARRQPSGERIRSRPARARGAGRSAIRPPSE
jgi:hypothetical protein